VGLVQKSVQKPLLEGHSHSYMMPMNRKTFVAAAAIFALLFSLAGMQIVGFVSANFGRLPAAPTVDVVIYSPKNSTTYNTRNVGFEFDANIYNSTSNVYVNCYLDGKLLKSFFLPMASYPVTLPTLTNGLHEVKVTASADYINPVIPGAEITTTSRVYFKVNSQTLNKTLSPAPTTSTRVPAVSILYPLNNSFFNVSIGGVNYKLIYETNSALSWVGYSSGGNGYSINGRGSGNVTVSGNGTWVHDFGTSGYHTLTLYANDTSGNWATPQTVTYIVNFYPDYTPLSSSSPTLEPTPAEPTPYDPAFHPFSPIGLYLGLASVLVAVVLVVYFLRRRRL